MAKRKVSTIERLNAGRMNRSQRRELGRRVAAGDPGLTVVHAEAGGMVIASRDQRGACRRAQRS